MLPELRREDWVRLDLSDARVIVNFPKVHGPLGVIEVESALLDTGSALPLLAPAREVGGLVQISECPPGTVGTAGGDVATRFFPAAIELGLWTFGDVEVHVSAQFERWVIGLPILKHFNLMFREPLAHRPLLWGPSLRAFDGARWL